MSEQYLIIAQADDVTSVVDSMISDVYGEDVHGGIGTPAGEHQKASMPQLDHATYSSQIFWLIISFVLLYVLVSRSALPRIHEIVDKRRHRIERDLERAEQLTREAEQAKESYEAIAAVSRQKANAAIDQAIFQNQKTLETALAKTDADVVAMLQKADKQIAEKRLALQQELVSVSEALASVLITEFSGKTISDATVKTAVAAVNS